MNEEQQHLSEKKYPAPLSAKFAGSALIAAVPMLAHFGPTGLLLSGVASLIAYRHGPEMYDMVRDTLPFLPSNEGRKGEVGTRDEHTMWNRLLGYHSELENQAGEQTRTAEERREQGQEDGNYWTYDEQDDEPLIDQSLFTFSQLLASGFRPTLHNIFLGRLNDGTDICVEAKDLCHVALAGNTGNGKSSLLRLIMAQLCSIGVNVVLLNPHYMVYDRDHDEDWTPYIPYLARDPLACAKFENIAYTLKWVVERTLIKRMELARTGQSVGKPYFVVIDELPAIVAERKECVVYVAKLLREGRKYGIYLIVASTDFLVKTTGLEAQGGAVRKCFRTACYVGGDSTTANVLLEKREKPIPETDLGKGTMMLRCAATRQAVLASVPYCDNEALYLLLGPSTYKHPVSEEEMDALVVELRTRPDIDTDDSRYESDESVKDAPASPNESQTEGLSITPVIAEKGPKAAEMDINVLCACWNGGANTVSKLETLFKMSHGEAYKAYKRIKAQKQEPLDEQE